MATTGNAADPAISVTSGDLEITNEDERLVGIEGFAVQAGPATVTAPSTVGAGENATFSVDSGLAGSSIDHGIVLYNESTLTSSVINLNVTAPVDENLSVDDVILEHTIETLSGVQQIENGVDFFGATFPNRTTTGSQSVADIIAFLANEGNVSGIQSDAVGSETLNASVTAVANRSATTNVTVGTLDVGGRSVPLDPGCGQRERPRRDRHGDPDHRALRDDFRHSYERIWGTACERDCRT
ncbi:MAG: hypothetical protein U5K37_05160 [Natrialbaceae archaeon]|nr:hypothetical protein [Natrialbaceae archaeon]